MPNYQTYSPSPIKFIQNTNVHVNSSASFQNIIGAGTGSLTIVDAQPGDIIQVEITGVLSSPASAQGAILHIDINGNTLGSIGVTIPVAAANSMGYVMITNCLILSSTQLVGNTTSIFEDVSTTNNPYVALTKLDRRGPITITATSTYTVTAEVQFSGVVAGSSLDNLGTIVRVLKVQ